MWKEIIIISCCLSGFLRGAVLPNLARTEQQLSQLLLKSNKSLQDDPKRTLDCFTSFLPQLSDHAAEYEKTHGDCINTYENKIGYVEKEMAFSRALLTNITTETCEAYVKCNQIPANVNFFNCYGQVAKNATKTSYDIDKTCSDNLAYMEIRFITIRYSRDACEENASRIYVQKSATTYEQLDKCLNNS